MSNCDNDINSQLKALHARIDRAENHLLAHTAQAVLDATAQISSADPIIAARGALKLAESLAYQKFMDLANSLPGVATFKQSMHLDSAALVDGLAASLANTAAGIITTAAATLQSTIDSKIAAETAYIIALEQKAAESVITPLFNSLNTAIDAMNTAQKSVNGITAFLKTLSDISSCQIQTSVLKAPNK